MFTIEKAKCMTLAVALTGIIAGSSVPAQAEPVNPKPGVKLIDREGDDYCHLQFPAIEPGTLASSEPRLKDWSSDDIVDYYGACDYDPVGKDEVFTQVQREQKQWDDGD